MSLGGLVAGLDVHSFGELVLRNFGYTTEACPDEGRFAQIGDAMARRMNAVHGSGYSSERSGELYPAMGSMDDWFYLAAGAMGMTIELRDRGTYGFMLPASQIVPTGQELLEAIIALSESL